MNPAVTPIKSSTQKFLEIADIVDDLVILKDGSCVLILTTTATNFGLLSEQEQNAEIYAYGSLLNSLSFTIQVLIRTQRKDISSYIHLLEEREQEVKNKKIKKQIQRYIEFIKKTVRVKNVLEKGFYIVVPMSALELGLGSSAGSKFKGSKKLPFPKERILKKAKINLYPKRDHLLRLFKRLGLQARQLTTQEIIQLFFEIYNPKVHGQDFSTTKDYETSLVQPAAVPTMKPESESAKPEPEPAKPEPQEKEAIPTPQVQETAAPTDQAAPPAPPTAPATPPQEPVSPPSAPPMPKPETVTAPETTGQLSQPPSKQQAQPEKTSAPVTPTYKQSPKPKPPVVETKPTRTQTPQVQPETTREVTQPDESNAQRKINQLVEESLSSSTKADKTKGQNLVNIYPPKEN